MYYAYDYESRMTQVTRPDSQTVNYAYDARGRRISRTFGSQWTRFTYDGDNVALDVNSDGSQVEYVDAGVDSKLWYTPSQGSSVLFLVDGYGVGP